MFDKWNDFGFLFCFISSAIMGCVLNFSIFHCTKVNSALTTTVIGMYTYVYMCMMCTIYACATFMCARMYICMHR